MLASNILDRIGFSVAITICFDRFKFLGALGTGTRELSLVENP